MSEQHTSSAWGGFALKCVRAQMSKYILKQKQKITCCVKEND